MADKLIDAAGISLADHHKWLPDRVALWPTPPKIVDKEAAGVWREWRFTDRGARCWYCKSVPGYPNRLEVHHMARHDAPWAFALLCSTCHRHDGEAVKSSSLPRLLRLKHQYDRHNTLWVQLALGLGRRLPVEDMEAARDG